MRLTSLFLILFLLSSCVNNKDKATQDESNKKETLQLAYLEKGGEIVKLSGAELLKNVARAMSEDGPGYAVDFCNVHALSIKDSLSGVYNCEIRRIAINYRNPADMAQTEVEEDQLNTYQEAHQKGEVLKPQVHLFDDRIDYYHPILINNGACLLCHGTPGQEITVQTMEIISSHYPGDLAINYAMDDFRGAWKISFARP